MTHEPPGEETVLPVPPPEPAADDLAERVERSLLGRSASMARARRLAECFVRVNTSTEGMSM